MHLAKKDAIFYGCWDAFADRHGESKKGCLAKRIEGVKRSGYKQK